MPSSPEPHQQQQQVEQEKRDLIELPITMSSSPPTLDLLVLEEKAEALRTDLLLRLEGTKILCMVSHVYWKTIKEMTNQMREAFHEASKAMFDTVSEWEQQAIDTLKTDIRGIKELEHEHSEWFIIIDARVL